MSSGLKRGVKTTAVGVQCPGLCVSAKTEGEGKAGAGRGRKGVSASVQSESGIIGVCQSLGDSSVVPEGY